MPVIISAPEQKPMFCGEAHDERRQLVRLAPIHCISHEHAVPEQEIDNVAPSKPGWREARMRLGDEGERFSARGGNLGRAPRSSCPCSRNICVDLGSKVGMSCRGKAVADCARG